jgi:hypothetical protein
VRATIERAVPIGSREKAMTSFARDGGLECSAPIDHVIYCSAPARSSGLVSAKWLITIPLAKGRIERVEVELGLTGP